MASPDSDKTFSGLLGAAKTETLAMFSLEAELFQAEIKATVGDAAAVGVWGAMAAVSMIAGAIVAIQGVILLLIWLGLMPFVAAFAVAALFLILGLLAALRARSLARGISILPQRTIAAAKSDFATLSKAIFHGQS